MREIKTIEERTGNDGKITTSLISNISSLLFLNKDEFMKKYREILDKECKKFYATSTSRDLKDTQIDTIAEQLFEIYKNVSFDEMKIYEALKKYEGLKSRYDRAVKIKEYLENK